MSKIKGPFTYEALPPEEIKFVPLNQSKELNGRELMEFYEVILESTISNCRMTSISENSCISYVIPLYILSSMIRDTMS